MYQQQERAFEWDAYSSGGGVGPLDTIHTRYSASQIPYPYPPPPEHEHETRDTLPHRKDLGPGKP